MKPKAPKNRKKGWKKVDTTELDDFIEDQRLQERTGFGFHFNVLVVFLQVFTVTYSVMLHSIRYSQIALTSDTLKVNFILILIVILIAILNLMTYSYTYLVLQLLTTVSV